MKEKAASRRARRSRLEEKVKTLENLFLLNPVQRFCANSRRPKMTQKKFTIMLPRVLFPTQGHNATRKEKNLQAIFVDSRNATNLNLIQENLYQITIQTTQLLTII